MIDSLVVMAAKKALGKLPKYNDRYRVIPYVNTNTRRINLPNNYIRYAQETANKKLILNFMRRLRASNENNYHGRGHFNRTMPGVYKNKKWKYFYQTTYYNRKLNEYQDIVLFYNNRNGDPVFIHPITGVRKPVKNERQYLGNINVNNFNERLRKRSKYNHWSRFTKKATRYISKSKRA